MKLRISLALFLSILCLLAALYPVPARTEEASPEEIEEEVSLDEESGVSEAEAAELINKLDSARENYVKRYAGVSRYDLRNYDIVISADGHTEEELADIIIAYIGRNDID